MFTQLLVYKLRVCSQFVSKDDVVNQELADKVDSAIREALKKLEKELNVIFALEV